MTHEEAKQKEYSLEFLTRLNEHYMVYMAIKEKNLWAEYEFRAKYDVIDKVDIEKEVEKEIDSLVNLPPEKKMWEMMNNFSSNFPGGLYREYLADEKIARSMGEVDLAERRQLFKDLDAAIAELGLAEKAEAIGKIRVGSLDNLDLLQDEAEAYFKMRDKGYDPIKLWQ